MAALVNATIEQVGALGALTDSVVEIERTISRLQAARDGMLAVGARLALDIARQGDTDGRDDGRGVDGRGLDGTDLALRAVAAELGAALRVSDRTVQRRMAEASFLVEQFPLLWQAQGAGRITAAQVRVILDAGAYLDDPADREAFSAQLVGFAETESPNRVGRMARRVAERFQPRPLEDRHRDARDTRRILALLPRGPNMVGPGHPVPITPLVTPCRVWMPCYGVRRHERTLAKDAINRIAGMQD
nr:DUF222 domain-containing protein [Microbacterium sp. SD291]